ncbi:FixH family protein [Sulfurimonas sp. SAG-AH-194-I05]|nr:FixH family protein [Sulfurimonas sp. SAG-AH-194-I05]MDF1874148.1 FixH family protein [Sulfurimonas sp. SAG-AH-194-I05]
MSNKKIWPYGISIAILLFFSAIVFSITFILSNTPVEKSNTYMMGYHHADILANDIIQDKIDFNKKYKVTYITESLSQEGATLKYTVHDLDGHSVNNATIKVVITRPDYNKDNQELVNPSIENGVYSFSNFTLASPGRWDIMAKITVGEEERFFNVKADTRVKEAFEY